MYVQTLSVSSDVCHSNPLTTNASILHACDLAFALRESRCLFPLACSINTERLSRNTAKGFFFRLKHDVIAPALLLSLLTFYYSALLCSHGEFQDLTYETNAVPSQTRPQLFEGLFDTSWSLRTASANRSAVLVRLATWKSIQLVRPVSVFDVSTTNFSCFSFTNGREGARASFTPLRSVAACLASCTCATDQCIASVTCRERGTEVRGVGAWAWS